jgi:hypothetical protein
LKSRIYSTVFLERRNQRKVFSFSSYLQTTLKQKSCQDLTNLHFSTLCHEPFVKTARPEFQIKGHSQTTLTRRGILRSLISVLFYKKTWCQGLDGLEVAFQILMPEDSCSNPEASSIYFKLTECVLVWACFNPSGILTQP